MGELLHEELELKITEIRHPNNPMLANPDDNTARYKARVIRAENGEVRPGEIVSLRMLHHGKANDYIGMTGIFDGDVNDVQDRPDEDIDKSRGARLPDSYTNPFYP
jgi:hypothetical protein